MPEILYEPTDKLPQELPIVYRPSRRLGWIVLAGCVVLVAMGLYLIAENSSQLIGVEGGFRARVPRWIFGWIATPLGLVGVALAVVTLIRDRPRIELNAQGIVIYPRFAVPYGWPWRDIARVEVKRIEPTVNLKYESLVLVMTDGREESFLAPESAERMRDSMMRVKARNGT